MPHLVPGGLYEFAGTVVPLPRERDVFRAEYTGATLRALGAPRPFGTRGGASMTERSLVVVGAGPRATGPLERIAASAHELWSGRPLRVHLVSPCPPGPGRVRRPDQSPVPRMNSVAEDVTMFTDGSSTVEGPVRRGPSLAAWAAQFAGRAPRWEPYAEPPSDVRDEPAGLAPTDFATRRAQGAYLDWVHRRVLAALPASIRVEHHATTATALTGTPGERQSVWLAGEAMPLAADLVVPAQGHPRSLPGREHEAAGEFAQAHGPLHLPPEYSCDARPGDLAPGEDLILRGTGPAFVDLVVLLTEGRGGSYAREADGSLRYVASGKEPVIHAGSRRGVPYHAKPGHRRAEAYLPRATPDRTADPLLRGLWERGELTEDIVRDTSGIHRAGLPAIDPDGLVVDPSAGGAHPRRIALGAPTNARGAADPADAGVRGAVVGAGARVGGHINTLTYQRADGSRPWHIDTPSYRQHAIRSRSARSHSAQPRTTRSRTHS